MFSADLGVNQVVSNPPATDPPFQKVALLLHGDGTNGAQNNTFTDSSTNNFTITRTGNVAQGTFSPFSLAEGQWSNYFDGSGDYLSVADNAALELGSGDFTIEGWVYPLALPSSGSAYTMVGKWASGGNISWICQYYNNAGTMQMAFGYSTDGNSAVNLYANAAITANSWCHLAYVRNGSSLKMFFNGTEVTSSTTISATLYNGTDPVNIGRNGFGVNYVNGYISNLRIVKGTALYTSNFTPPTAPLTAISGTSLLTCQSNRFKDNSSNNFTITSAGDAKVTAFSPFAPSAAYDASTNGGSGYFDGSGDYLQAPTSTSLDFGTGDFTVEAWINTTNLSVQNTILEMRPPTTNGDYLFFAIKTTGVLFIYVSSSDRITSSSGAIKINTWNHVAVSRSSGNTKMFINGVQAGSTWSDTTNYTADAPRIGQSKYSGYPENFNGYITDVRIVKGTAVYTANFTPPTAPLTAITNTQLLLNCTNAGIIDNAGKNDIETVGNAQISTSVKKYGTGSMYFDGTGDYCSIASNTTALLFGTGAFTIEFWFNTNSSTRYAQFVGNEVGTSGEIGFTILINNTTSTSGDIAIYRGSSGLINSATSTSYRDNNWHHLAFVRDSAGSRLFIDGVQQGTTTASQASTSFDSVTGFRLSIGANLQFTGRDYLGYIDDLRITKGQALYTSNFTPPTQAFPNV